MEAAAGLKPRSGRALVKALRSQGLIEPAGRGEWTITQAGQSLSSATAAKRVTRATAEKALQQFLGRVEQVNNDPYFLSKVTRVVLFGSMLKPGAQAAARTNALISATADLDDRDLEEVTLYARFRRAQRAKRRA